MLSETGKFELVDDETKEVLLNNGHISKVTVVSGQVTEGISVYLQMKFNKEGTEKLEEISKIYKETKVHEEEDHEHKEGEEETATKKVSIMYDDTAIKTTYFGETVTDGTLNILIGTTNDQKEYSEYRKQGIIMANVLNIGKMPIVYKSTAEDFTSSINFSGNVRVGMYVVATILIIGFMFIIIKFKLNAIYSIILQIGYISSVLLILKLTNVPITIEGIFGIIIGILINYMFMYVLLNNILKSKMKYKEGIKSAFLKIIYIVIPIYIVAVIFTFGSVNVVASFGMTIVWGTILFYVYNSIFTNILLKLAIKEA